jgi:hypothetical protein
LRAAHGQAVSDRKSHLADWCDRRNSVTLEAMRQELILPRTVTLLNQIAAAVELQFRRAHVV